MHWAFPAHSVADDYCSCECQRISWPAREVGLENVGSPGGRRKSVFNDPRRRPGSAPSASARNPCIATITGSHFPCVGPRSISRRQYRQPGDPPVRVHSQARSSRSGWIYIMLRCHCRRPAMRPRLCAPGSAQPCRLGRSPTGGRAAGAQTQGQVQPRRELRLWFRVRCPLLRRRDRNKVRSRSDRGPR
jgi:hypothetical protein